jgi:hypothetical protein
MPFDYVVSNLSARYGTELKARFNDTFVREVKERARLLFNLRVPLEDAIRRISENIEWEFDDAWTGGLPAIHKKTRDVIKSVYAHLTK